VGAALPRDERLHLGPALRSVAARVRDSDARVTALIDIFLTAVVSTED
jgi:hypothetical protein